MSAATRARAPSGVTWDGINWANVQRHLLAATSTFVIIQRGFVAIRGSGNLAQSKWCVGEE
ncbi:hypothetical protein [Paraburkholderia sp. GAS32]|uniref:hypothetical protein n=1 Tax=Paraburkholderia sp. GAS32 TaxID=3035129 RepID=UPI003D1EEEA8